MVSALKDQGSVVDVAGPLLEQPLECDKWFQIGPIQRRTANGIFYTTLRALAALVPGSRLLQWVTARDYGISVHEQSWIFRPYTIVVVEEIELLPAALRLRSKTAARVVVEFRDFYPPTRSVAPREVLRSLRMRKLIKLLDDSLVAVAVSSGQAAEIEHWAHLTPKVLRSLPARLALEPRRPYPDRIRMVYHGMALRNRGLEHLLELMKLLDSRFELDLFLVPGDSTYIRHIRDVSAGQPKVTIHSPVPYSRLLRLTNAFDIGLLYYEPVTANHLTTLPNKVFEYLQSGLAVASGPSPDVARELSDYGCLIKSDSFGVDKLAQRLSALSDNEIWLHKKGAHRAAMELCFENEMDRYRSVLGETINAI